MAVCEIPNLTSAKSSGDVTAVCTAGKRGSTHESVGTSRLIWVESMNQILWLLLGADPEKKEDKDHICRKQVDISSM
jgi:hypothetical protein